MSFGTAGSYPLSWAAMNKFTELVDARYQVSFRFGMSLTGSVARGSDLVLETLCI
jgi:DNA-directed RNA polymerase specialized sigma24 family protein